MAGMVRMVKKAFRARVRKWHGFLRIGCISTRQYFFFWLIYFTSNQIMPLELKFLKSGAITHTAPTWTHTLKIVIAHLLISR